MDFYVKTIFVPSLQHMMGSITGTGCTPLCAGMIVVSYLIDFSYFSLKIVFRKLMDMVRTGQK
jgi:hypothetical protein